MAMADLEGFLKLVEQHPTEADFVGPIGPRVLDAAQSTLALAFPPTYRRFVQALGAGDFAGHEFYGIVGSDFVNSAAPDAVWLTLTARREWELPEPMIVIYFDGGTDYYVLDVAKRDHHGQPPVEVWRPGVSTAQDPLEQVDADFGSLALRLAREGLGLS